VIHASSSGGSAHVGYSCKRLVLMYVKQLASEFIHIQLASTIHVR